VCELHQPLGNLRQQSFQDIWNSERATRLRQAIAAKACHCTTEVFLWPSIVYQPKSLTQAIVGARVWEQARPLGPGEKIAVTSSDGAPR
jgi:hypothetical protein